MSRRGRSKRAERGWTGSRPCCTACALAAEPRSSGQCHPTVQPRMPCSLVDAPDPQGTSLPPCVESPWRWFGRPREFAMTA
jgi:hypothetical protein